MFVRVNLSAARLGGSAQPAGPIFFYNLALFFEKKLHLTSMKEVNSSLNPEVDVRTHDFEVRRLGVIDLGSEMSDQA